MQEKITIFESLDSTNNYAMQQIHAGMAADEAVFLALQQTAGKGHHGKTWMAENGQSILMSKVLQIFSRSIATRQPTDSLIRQQFQLSTLVAVATRAWFASYAGDNVFIKWPNDIYYGDRKAGGILIENILQGSNWKWAVVGIGININQYNFPIQLANPISLSQITEKKYDVIELANELNSSIEKYVAWWEAGRWQEIFDNYNNNLYRKDMLTRLRKGNVIMTCTLKSVSEDGRLLIQEDDAISFSVGEVSFEDLRQRL